MILQLSPSIPLITPKGQAVAHFLIDEGLESDLYWVCAQQDTGECWTWSNRDIRFCTNITVGRTVSILEDGKKDRL
jgi:hypothetical protein